MYISQHFIRFIIGITTTKTTLVTSPYNYICKNYANNQLPKLKTSFVCTKIAQYSFIRHNLPK